MYYLFIYFFWVDPNPENGNQNGVFIDSRYPIPDRLVEVTDHFPFLGREPKKRKKRKEKKNMRTLSKPHLFFLGIINNIYY